MLYCYGRVKNELNYRKLVNYGVLFWFFSIIGDFVLYQVKN